MSGQLRLPRINTITLAGRLTKDVEVRYSSKGMAIAKLNIAFDRSMQDETGTYQNVSNFIEITAFGKTAEIAAEQLHKGSALIVEGQFQYRNYTDRDNQPRRIYEILANKIYPLERDENYSEKDNKSTYQKVGTPHSNDSYVENSYQEATETKDDIPF